MTKRYLFATIIFMAGSITSFSQKTSNAYQFTIDLVNVQDDKVKVELIAPQIKKNQITYHLPKIIPGTYSEDDFGRYIERFKATDKKGAELPVSRLDTNSWTISSAEKLFKISYLVNDSYDDGATKQVIFEPAGSNIQKDTNYVINNHCFLGYFDDMKSVPYEVTILHPASMYGSTALTDMDKKATSDKFITESYNRIVDNPIMYDVPDTSVIRVGNTDVLISVFSLNKKITSAALAKKLSTLLQAQGKYLGGKLPVEKYAFIIYLDKRLFGYSHAEGALEHSYCSMYYYGNKSEEQLSQEFVDHAAHEFFHIITPLTIHSEEIQNFDFNHPKMSRHLWLYEGSTEYHAHMVQVKYGLITPDQLLTVLTSKINFAKNFYNDTVPFTVMSSGVLGVYKPQFGNVYQKGALINMCLDIKLLQLSKGKYGIMNLIHDLSNKYGKQKGFVDSTFFDEIEKLTYPEIRKFLDTYVAGPTPLPLQEYFALVGINYQAEMDTKDSAFSLGKISLAYNPQSGRMVVKDTTGMNVLGRKLGYHPGDVLMSLNGKDITGANQKSVTGSLYGSAKVGDSLTVLVSRKNPDGTDGTATLTGSMTKFPVKKYNVLSYIDNLTEEQAMLKNIWLKP
ncbi:MAG: peptidase M61 [Bacteroidetes bacterium]|nr:peptidase M61 [Bacteroidota bacterium]